MSKLSKLFKTMNQSGASGLLSIIAGASAELLLENSKASQLAALIGSAAGLGSAYLFLRKARKGNEQGYSAMATGASLFSAVTALTYASNPLFYLLAAPALYAQGKGIIGMLDSQKEY